MRVAATLAAFAVGLVVVFALSFGVGRAVGPADDGPTSTTTTAVDHEPGMDMDGHP